MSNTKYYIITLTEKKCKELCVGTRSVCLSVCQHSDPVSSILGGAALPLVKADQGLYN